MLDILKFIFETPLHFFGIWFLMATMLTLLVSAIRNVKGK